MLAGAVVTSVLAVAAAQSPARPPRPFEVVPGVHFGAIDVSTTRAGLPRLYPRARIADVEVPIGEGYCTPGAQVFAGTPDAIDVVWQDTAKTEVAFARTITPGGRWATRSGVRLGTTLTELERIGGRVLTFSGFGWDYGGGAQWEEPTGRLDLRLDVDPRDRGRGMGPGTEAIYGDREVRSDLPLVRQLRIVVVELSITWGMPASDRFCG